MRQPALTILFILFVFSTSLAHDTGHEVDYHVLHPPKSIYFTSEEVNYIHNKKEITMCTDPDWMPYEGFEHGDHYVGVAADYHKIIEHQTGLKYKIIHTKTWGETIEKAKNGECDLLSILNESPERKEFLDFSEPYIQSPSVFVSRENDIFINNIEDLQDHTIAIVKGYVVDELISSTYPQINRIYVHNISEALQMVSSGKAFATVGSLLEMSYNMRHMGLTNLKITGDANFSFSLRIGVKKGDKILLSIVNKAVSSISKEDKNNILNKWISIKYNQPIDYSMVIKIMSGMFLIIIIVISRYMITAKYNKMLKNLNSELQIKEAELQQINKNLEIKISEETAKRLENERILMQQSKLASMGDMIGAIAHQWRQPLNALGLLVQDVEDQFECGVATAESVKETTTDAMIIIQQMSQTITDFSNFFKPDKSSECFKICKYIKDVAGMLNPQMKSHGITLHMQCMDKNLDGKIPVKGDPFDCCETYCVHGYPNEFKHVILNILKNSMDALDSVKMSDKEIIINITQSNDRYIIIEVHDNGGGISKEIAGRIFEPYFSTKMEGKGVGIGLYMSKQILANMKGDIWFENKGEGASFFLKLKLCDH